MTSTRLAGMAAAMAATAALLTGCGGGDSAATADGGAARQDMEAAFTEYRECMSDNGVTLAAGPGGGAPTDAPPADAGTPPTDAPTGAPPADAGTPPAGAPTGAPPADAGTPPAGGGGPGMQKPDGVSTKTWNAALEACQSLMPAGPGGGQAPSPTS